MKLEEAYHTYSFRNVGQFRGIAESLGYTTEYHNGVFLFTRKDDHLSLRIEDIRSKSEKTRSMDREQRSKERVSTFFDKDRANDSHYRSKLEKEGISIKRWENLKGGEKDGFTIIDHHLKVCYTGQELYDHAYKQGNLLDGKGSRLAKGIMSNMMDIHGKQGKVRFSENGICVFYKKETLTIPEKMLGHKLSKQEKEQLLSGEIVPITTKKGDVFLQVDRDLNSVIVRSKHEIRIPNIIGQTKEFSGYKLTKADKHLLANGHTLDNLLLHSKDGYIIADISLTEDKKGIRFENIQSISQAKAKELIKEITPKLEAHSLKLEKGKIPDKRDLESELREAIGKRDFEKLDQLREEGYKPSEKYIRGLGNDMNLSEKELKEVENIFSMVPIEKGEREKQVSKLLDASLSNNFAIIQEIQSKGYKLTINDLEMMQEKGVQPNTLIALKKIFGMESKGKIIGEVKLASVPQHENQKDLTRPIANTINRAFNDL